MTAVVKQATSATLQIHGLSKGFDGLRVLEDIDIELEGAGAFWGLIGPNGSGKTTLFNCISGHLRPDRGNVLMSGRQMKLSDPRSASRQGLGRTFQQSRVFARMSVMENLLAAGRTCEDPRERAHRLLDLVELRHLAGHAAGTLSIGQQKLVELVRALMPAPQLVLLDEIAAGIHPRMVQRIAGYLRELSRDGTRFFLVEHDVDFVSDLCHQLFVLNAGSVLASGPPHEVLARQDVIHAYIGPTSAEV